MTPLRVALCAIALWLAGCAGPQSALDPAGREAERIAGLFWWMVAGGALIWWGVVGLTIYAARRRVKKLPERQARFFIIGGGVVFPTLILAGLLAYGLAMLPDLVAPAPEGSRKIKVVGEQWWWRVIYTDAQGKDVELANEIYLPVNEPVAFELESRDVIHSFWIPPLGGKMDMIPGRTTRLVLTPTRTGIFRGVCAEYCGTSHALMAPLAARGRDAFLANGCAACHAVRGTPARGAIGPDLTHVGGRMSLGGGIVPNEPVDFARWIVHADRIKPEVLMPHFGMLPADELEALAAYLESLK
jgi:cytochrome c oxidase subunit 2